MRLAWSEGRQSLKCMPLDESGESCDDFKQMFTDLWQPKAGLNNHSPIDHWHTHSHMHTYI